MNACTPGISMELSTAYPLNAMNFSYLRSISLDKQNSRVDLHDHTNAKDVILNFITYEKPVIDGNCIRIGAEVQVKFTGATELGSESAIEVLPITDARLQKAWDHDLYRIRLRLTEEDFYMTIE